ncbi:MAG: serine/threonine-protein kinase [Acidobacteriota bacterium]
MEPNDPHTADPPTETLDTETLGGRGPRTDLRRGDGIGRYVVLDPIGEGGMGRVYSAYDPELDRRVALKLPTGSRGRGARLIREARALARLNHPNVISVHDAGNDGDQVWIATELVQGVTFDDWLRAEGRTPEEVVDVLLRAGRGLAAAHRAGLIHRDVKGSNMMVADDGRVLMLDFGLARASAATPSQGTEPGLEIPSPRPGPGQGQVQGDGTRVGAVLGTPAYMAPEQRRGDGVGPAADQYSFCVVAFHALTGRLPTPGDDGDGLPPYLRRPLARGLALDPDDRHPSMDALLEDLARDPGRRRRAAAWVAVALAAAGWGATWLLTSRSAPDPLEKCAAGAERLASAWGPSARSLLFRYGGSGPGATGTGAAAEGSIAAGLEAYGTAWTAMYRDACEATHLRGDQSAELLDLRMECLHRSLRDVASVVEIVADVDSTSPEQRARLDEALAPPFACADARGLLAPTAPPEDPEGRARLTTLQDRLAEARALWMVADYDAGTAVADDAVRRAEDLGYWPAVAEAWLERARFHESAADGDGADDALVRALLAAEAGGHQRAAARGFLRRIRVQAHLLRQPEDAEQSAHQAEALLERSTAPGPLSAELLELRGLVAMRQGRVEDARDRYAAALEAKARIFGDDHLSLAGTFVRVGDAAFELGRWLDARGAFEGALELYRRHLGQGHPHTAGVLAQLGAVDLELGDFDGSLRRHREALDLRRAALGDDHDRVAMSLTDLASALTAAGRFPEARDAFAEALGVFERRHGDDHPYVAIALANLGSAQVRQGQPVFAIPLFQRALDIQTRTHRAGHPRIAEAAFNLGECLRLAGRPGDALPHLRRAEGAWAAALGTGHGRLADVHTALGAAELDLGRPERALPLLRRASAPEMQADRRADARAKTDFALARTLGALDLESERALRLARGALLLYGEAPARNAPEIAAVRAWLNARWPDPAEP